jgi:uncharacterized protein (TIGR02246 family)
MRTICSLAAMVILGVALWAFAADDQKKEAKPANPAPPAKSTTKPQENADSKTRSKTPEPGAKERIVKTDDKGETASVASDDDEPGAPPTKYPDEEQALLKTAEAFVQAYAKRDAKAVAALFAPEAEYVDAVGEVFQGRENIEQTIEEFFKAHPDVTLLLDIASIRFLSPMLAIEDGTTLCTMDNNGTPEESRYTAIHTKLDGQWQLASVREHGAVSARQHAQRIKQLAWLVGNWVDEDDDSVVHFNCRPSDDGNFMLRDFEVAVGGQTVIHGTQRIGWDPVSGKFRTWTFDSQGGYFDGYLTSDGERWILSSSGVTADGQAASGKAIFTQVNGHTITWQAVDREINGATIEDSEEFTLVKKGPQPEVGASESEKAPNTKN